MALKWNSTSLTESATITYNGNEVTKIIWGPSSVTIWQKAVCSNCGGLGYELYECDICKGHNICISCASTCIMCNGYGYYYLCNSCGMYLWYTQSSCGKCSTSYGTAAKMRAACSKVNPCTSCDGLGVLSASSSGCKYCNYTGTCNYCTNGYQKVTCPVCGQGASD